MQYLEIINAVLTIIRQATPDFDKQTLASKITEFAESLKKEQRLEELSEHLQQLFSPKNNDTFDELITAIKNEDNPPIATEALTEVAEDAHEEENFTEYGFQSREEMQCYAKLRPYCVLASFFEDNDQNLVYAHKLTIAFGDFAKASAYLEKYYQVNKDSYRLFHDACLFNLSDGAWDLVVWRELASKHLVEPQFAKTFGFARKIERLHAALKLAVLQPAAEQPAEAQPAADSESLQKRAYDFLQQEFNKTLAISKAKETSKIIKKFAELTKQFANYNLQEHTDRQRYIVAQLENKKAELHSAIKKVKTKLSAVARTDIATMAAPAAVDEEIKQQADATQQTKQHVFMQQRLGKLAAELINLPIAALEQQFGADFDAAAQVLAQTQEQYIASCLERTNFCEKDLHEQLNACYSSPLTGIKPEKLYQMALCAGYERAAEYLAAVELLLPLGVPEQHFNIFLDIHNSRAAKNSDPQLPKVFIDGASYGYKNVYLIKINDDDPKGPFLGYPTGCCQNIGSAGEACAVHGYTQENGCFYALCRGTPPQHLASSQEIPARAIIGVTWAWRSWDRHSAQYSNIVVFDNVEANRSAAKTEAQKNMFRRLFTILAKEIIAQTASTANPVLQVNIGLSYGIKDMGYQNTQDLGLVNPDGSNYAGYRDSKKQQVLYAQQDAWFGELILNPLTAIKQLPELETKFIAQYSLQIMRQVLKFADGEAIKEFLAWYDPITVETFLGQQKITLIGYLIQQGNLGALQDFLANAENHHLLNERYPETTITPLLEAVYAQQHNIIALLLNSQAVTEATFAAKYPDGSTIIDKLLDNKDHQTLIKILQHPKMTPAIFNMLDQYGETILWRVISKDFPKYYALVAAILASPKFAATQLTAIKDRYSRQKETPLLWAVRNKNLAFLQLLLTHRHMTHDIFAMRDGNKRSIVELAIETNDADIINTVLTSQFMTPELLQGKFICKYGQETNNLLQYALVADWDGLFDWVLASPLCTRELFLTAYRHKDREKTFEGYSVLELCFALKRTAMYGKVFASEHFNADLFLTHGDQERSKTVLQLALTRNNPGDIEFFIACMQHPKMTAAIFNMLDQYGETILWRVISKDFPKYYALVAAILASPKFAATQLTAIKDRYSRQKETPLLWAVRNKNLAFLQLLLTHRHMTHDIFAMRDGDKRSIVELAIETNDADIINAVLTSQFMTPELLQGKFICKYEQETNNLLQYALVADWDGLFDWVLASPLCTRELFLTAYRHKDRERTFEGYSVLELCFALKRTAMYGKVFASEHFNADLFLTHGDQERSKTVLQLALTRNNPGDIEFFIACMQHPKMTPAIFNMLDQYGETILWRVISKGFPKYYALAAAILASPKFAATQLTAIKDRYSRQKETPLLWAVRNKNLAFLQLLLTHRHMTHDIFAMRDGNKRSIVELAIETNDADIINTVLTSQFMTPELLQGKFIYRYQYRQIETNNLLQFAIASGNEELLTTILGSPACTVTLIIAELQAKKSTTPEINKMLDDTLAVRLCLQTMLDSPDLNVRCLEVHPDPDASRGPAPMLPALALHRQQHPGPAIESAGIDNRELLAPKPEAAAGLQLASQ